ncbi:MAG TPA: hypothetical protein DCQ98_17525 [Planctomycetaceae bacterium]|nr:hypothetical protein [Planctomycetaceae bacterium]
MDDELELTDPDHVDAQDAAAATARLLLAIHRQRREQGLAAEIASEEDQNPCPIANDATSA